MTLTESEAVLAGSVPSQVDTPCLVVDLDVVERNIAALVDALRARGVALRPHAKTHKSVPIARMQLDAGATGITVGTIGEAEVFAAAGIRDLFVAYPVWADGAKASRLRAVHEAADLSVGVDSAESARRLGSATAGSAKRLGVLVEIDSGGSRTGVSTAEEAVAVASAARDAGLEVVGVFTHGGHSYVNAGAGETAGRDEVTTLAGAAAALRDAGFDVRRISAGSTPTMTSAAMSPVNEIRAGTYVFGDRTQLALGAIGSDGVAALVASTVVSVRSRERYVIDAGAKILTKDRPEFLAGYGLLPSDPEAVIERVYDYHGVVVRGRTGVRVGATVAVVPNHICPVVNLVDDFVVTRGGRVVGRWRVDARGRNG